MGIKTMESGLKSFDDRYAKQRVDHEILSNFDSELRKYNKAIAAAVEADESEEHIKKIINDFLQKNFYASGDYEINTNKRSDSSIKYKGKLLAIIETKNPKNKSEMLRADNINKKALWELVCYYLEETRVTTGEKLKPNSDSELRRLIVTDSIEWFIFNAQDLDKICNGYLEQQYYKYKNGLLSFNNNADKFYALIEDKFNEIAITEKLNYIYFDLNGVIGLKKQQQYMYKILNKAYLLKDGYKKISESHVLNNKFYKELLYIMGLKEEKKEGRKRIIVDNSIANSLISQTLSIIINDKGYSDKDKALEEAYQLVIIWINRLLFIKLFEGQLLAFNGDSECYHILDNDKINSFQQLNELFFDVFGNKDRADTPFINQFSEIPYLNSSLFERYEIEKKVININSIKNENVNVKAGSVLGKKITVLPLLEYIIDFLASYSFSSQLDSDGNVKKKSEIIDASVLGLIFEKINGYKDGSFYTKGFVTEYICKETLEKQIIERLNNRFSWDCTSMEDVQLRINRTSLDELKNVNEVINSIKICDPAVGSGHFLVSAMNRIIAIKKDLGVLLKADNKGVLNEYEIEIVDDVLCIYDGQGIPFKYDKSNALSQCVQKTLFQEKKTIIENCLFGVDINSNAVAICQLRLWIELLKNAYYENGIMETLPNIDINIKCGNSLISKLFYKVGDKISTKDTLLGSGILKEYKKYVNNYKATSNKEEKKQAQIQIAGIKKSLYEVTEQVTLDTDKNGNIIYSWHLDTSSDDIYKNNSFEWAIEFPEIIDDKGIFNGFDCIIGNPPYIRIQKLDYRDADYYKENYNTAYKKSDISTLFFELANMLVSKSGRITYITSNQFLTADYGMETRKYLLKKKLIDKMIDFEDLPVFDDALTYVSIFFLSSKRAKGKHLEYYKVPSLPFVEPDETSYIVIDLKDLSEQPWELYNKEEKKCLSKIKAASKFTLKSFANCWAGAFTGCDELLMVDYNDSLPIEEDLQIPVIRADSCNRYGIATPTKKIFYPYVEKDDDTILLTIDELESIYPKTKEFIYQHEEKLKERQDSRKTFASRKDWYGLVRHGKLSRFKQTKIVSPGEVKHNKFCIDTSGSAFSCGRVFSINIDNDSIDIRYLLAILNSKVCEFFLHKTAALKSGGYYAYSSTAINAIPIVIDDSYKDILITAVDELQSKVQSAEDPTLLENRINEIVYKMYGLNKNDISVIEKAYND